MKKIYFLAIALLLATNSFAVVTALFYEDFYSGKGDFTIDDKNLSGLTYVWSESTDYHCMKASAYVGGAKEAESWLVSPEIDLTSVETATLTFEHALNYGTKGDISVKIFADGTWTTLAVPSWPAGGNWVFISSGDINLSSFVGKKVKIAFAFVSTTTNCPTWQIKNIVITGGTQSIYTPATYNLTFDNAKTSYYTPGIYLPEIAVRFLILYANSQSEFPQFNAMFAAEAKDKMNGTHATIEAAYIQAAGDTVLLSSSEITINCTAAETNTTKPIYAISGTFTAKNGDTYIINSTIPVAATELGYIAVTLTDIEPDFSEIIKELPLEVPNVGGNVKVCAQNLRNYFFTYTHERSDCKNAWCFAEKTHDIVDVFHFVNADIYALNEFEATNQAVAQLVDSLNVGRKNPTYAYVVDDAENTGAGDTKAAFIYRKDRVKPVGNNTTTAPGQYVYVRQMRVQAFEHLATGAQFAVSSNHFKAKDNTEDQGEQKRVNNANTLVSGLRNIAKNYPDILIVGDLNCEMGEKPLEIIENAGYEEMLVHYNPNAFSHCYYGQQLIDHVFANASMKEHITGAAVYHISTSCGEGSSVNYDYRYSDHDPYLVGLQFDITDAIETIESQKVASVYVHQNTIFVNSTNTADIEIYNIQGQKVAHQTNVNSAQIQLSQGFYLVKIGSQVEKVVVK